MLADPEKICDGFTDFPASGPILKPKRTYPFAKWRTLKLNLLGKKGSLMKRISTFSYHSGRNTPAFWTKINPDHKDQNKCADLLHYFSGPTNRHDKSQHVNRPLPFVSSAREIVKLQGATLKESGN